MAPWHRIASANLLRCLAQRRRLLLPAASSPSPAVGRGSTIFGLGPVRSFAAPVQAKAKAKPNAHDPSNGPRMNGDIKASQVRLVTDQGHTIVSKWEALDRAKSLSLDLVEVQGNADPPVCKIMDYHKEKYKHEEKGKERTKDKAALRHGDNKEIRFKGKTELKDLKIKAETITRLMERGYKVKCTAQPRGKGQEDLGALLSKILSLIADVSIVESGPHIGALQAYVVVRHVKFSQKKKSGKKVSEVIDAISNGVFSVIPDGESEPAEEAEVVTEHAPDNDVEEDTVSSYTGGTMENSRPVHTNARATGRIPEPGPGLGPLPSVGETNRYSKPSELKGGINIDTDNRPGFNQGRAPQQPPRNDMDRRSQFDNRPVFNQSRVPQQPPRNDMDRRSQFDNRPVFNQARVPQQPPRDDMDRHSQFDRSGRQPDPSKPIPPPPRFGNFISPNPALHGDQRQSTDRNNTHNDNRATPNPMRVPQQPNRNEHDRYGQWDPRQRQVNASHPGTPPNYGAPSSPRNAFSGDRNFARGPTMVKPSDHGPLSPTNSGDQSKYGNFSPKPANSDNHRNIRETGLGESGQAKPKPSYGIFSPKTTSSS